MYSHYHVPGFISCCWMILIFLNCNFRRLQNHWTCCYSVLSIRVCDGWVDSWAFSCSHQLNRHAASTSGISCCWWQNGNRNLRDSEYSGTYCIVTSYKFQTSIYFIMELSLTVQSLTFMLVDKTRWQMAISVEGFQYLFTWFFLAF
jgi:hypothetical protein